ncbi:MAG: 50S ribosome-binding protein YggL [Desulfoferrobacter sp.]
MKKRLRKKRRIAEFATLGVPVAIRLVAGTDFDSFLDAFLMHAVEKSDCYFWGKGSEVHLSGLIELGRPVDRPEQRLKQIVDWLDASEEVEKHVVGTIVDAWYGPFDELETIEQRI